MRCGGGNWRHGTTANRATGDKGRNIMRDNRNPRFGDFEELLGDDVPRHLRPDAPPLGQCDRCLRQTWSADEVGTEDRMTQPDGNSCGGRIVNAPSTRVVDQFTGRVTDPVQSEQQFDYLWARNGELETRNQELEAENEELKATARLVIETIERLLAD
jgi:hypothetical protein